MVLCQLHALILPLLLLLFLVFLFLALALPLLLEARKLSQRLFQVYQSMRGPHEGQNCYQGLSPSSRGRGSRLGQGREHRAGCVGLVLAVCAQTVHQTLHVHLSPLALGAVRVVCSRAHNPGEASSHCAVVTTLLPLLLSRMRSMEATLVLLAARAARGMRRSSPSQACPDPPL